MRHDVEKRGRRRGVTGDPLLLYDRPFLTLAESVALSRHPHVREATYREQQGVLFLTWQWEGRTWIHPVRPSAPARRAGRPPSPSSLRARRPWAQAGISRATWYRRLPQGEGRLPQGGRGAGGKGKGNYCLT